jgi:hypothetical protein
MDLWRLIEKAGVNNTYYTDTDCVLVDQIGRDALSDEMDEYRLGALKLAGEYDDVEIWSSKDYRFGSKSKTKGVRKQAIWLDGHTVRQEQWSGLRGLVNKNMIDAPTTRTIVKHLTRLYDKGIVLESGEIRPHRL